MELKDAQKYGHKNGEPVMLPAESGFTPMPGRQPGTRSIGLCGGKSAYRSSRYRRKRRVAFHSLLFANRTSYITPPSCICKPALPAGRLSHPLSRAAKKPEADGSPGLSFSLAEADGANDSSPKECYVLRTICAAKLRILD